MQEFGNSFLRWQVLDPSVLGYLRVHVPQRANLCVDRKSCTSEIGLDKLQQGSDEVCNTNNYFHYSITGDPVKHPYKALF